MVEVSTSLLSVEKNDVIKTIYNLETAGTNYFHIDVMDGKFVENNTTEKMREYSEYIKTISNLPLDVHLMVKDVESYISSYLILEPNIITFHYEAIRDLKKIKELVKYIKQNHCKVGIAISPNTDTKEILEILPYIHMILIMTVEPGKGGQNLIEFTIEKIRNIKKYIDENHLEIDIEADGGINLENVSNIKNAGADIIVSGNAIIKSENYREVIKRIKNA